MSSGPTRRSLLQATLAVGVGGLAGVAGGDDAPSASRQTGTEIPAPFDAMPTIDDPTEKERLGASVNYPPEAVPDEGAIPDVYHQHTREVQVTVPEWALAAARWRLEQRAEHRGRDELGRGDAVDFLFEYAQPMPEFVTPDGRDAVGALLADVQVVRDD